MRAPRVRRKESGQAAVEAAITLPLTIFLFLGTIQLFMMLQGRLLAEYAAFRAVRVGSTHHGDCFAMYDAALVALMPSVFPGFLATNPGHPDQALAEAYAARRAYDPNEGNANADHSLAGIPPEYNPALDNGYRGPIMWLFREQPLAPGGGSSGFIVPDPEDIDFDTPVTDPKDIRRLEIRMVFWFPLKIPFANWVMAKMFMAAYGIQGFLGTNPIMPSNQANWTTGAPTLAPSVAAALKVRITNGEYVAPIQATATMRMMTPAKRKYFTRQHCPGWNLAI